MSPPPRAAALFDIDGTLLDASGAGRNAFLRALEEWHGAPIGQEGLELAGRTDMEIFRGVLERAGIPYPSPPERRQLIRRYLALLTEELSATGSPIVLPGVQDLLVALAADARWILGLLTGNIEPGAWTKIRFAGLDRWFSFGAFGSDHEDRDRLVPIALARLRRKRGIALPPASVVVVGDTLRDIQCARAAGAKVVIVGTGLGDPRALRQARPDAYFTDLSDTGAVLDRLRRLAS